MCISVVGDVVRRKEKKILTKTVCIDIRVCVVLSSFWTIHLHVMGIPQLWNFINFHTEN